MKNIKPVLGVVIAATLIYLVYLLFKRSRPVAPVSVDGTGVVLPEMGGSGGTVSDVGCSSGCCQNPCSTINLENPAANYGCCGSVVQEFQIKLNNLAGAGFNLTPDGAYGPNTQAAHQQLLTTNNGVWPEFVGPTQPE
jgi:hypothetical protein